MHYLKDNVCVCVCVCVQVCLKFIVASTEVEGQSITFVAKCSLYIQFTNDPFQGAHLDHFWYRQCFTTTVVCT